jgi:hypothetical protein
MPRYDFRGYSSQGGSYKSGNPIIVMMAQGSGISGNASQSGGKKNLQMSKMEILHNQ